MQNKILVLPRDMFSGYDRLVPWHLAAHLINAQAPKTKWLLRNKAETSAKWSQPIPVALIRNQEGGYFALRRIQDTRLDLQRRISLVVGGHVDEKFGSETLYFHLKRNLLRELDEELGLKENQIRVIGPVGLVVDAVSWEASKHVAFVFEVQTAVVLKTKAKEEFSVRSKYTGRFYFPGELRKFRTRFDPWSLVLFEDYIGPKGAARIPRQSQLPFPFDNSFGVQRTHRNR